jgi:hypothetical protein
MNRVDTVHGEIAYLRHRFGVRSTAELVRLVNSPRVIDTSGPARRGVMPSDPPPQIWGLRETIVESN